MTTVTDLLDSLVPLDRSMDLMPQKLTNEKRAFVKLWADYYMSLDADASAAVNFGIWLYSNEEHILGHRDEEDVPGSFDSDRDLIRLFKILGTKSDDMTFLNYAIGAMLENVGTMYKANEWKHPR